MQKIFIANKKKNIDKDEKMNIQQQQQQQKQIIKLSSSMKDKKTD